MNSIVLLFPIGMNNTFTLSCHSHAGSISETTQHTQPNDAQHNDTHNTIQRNDNVVIFTYKTMAEVLGAVASAVTVVEAAGKVWSTGWKYYKVRIPANKFEPQLIVNNFYMGLGC